MAKNKTGLMTVALCNGFVRADAKTGLICLTDMAKLGEVITGKEVRIENWTRLESTKDFIEYVETQQNQGDSRTLTSEGTKKEVWKTVKGRNASTWANLHIAIDFAMWISVEFKYEVIDTFINKKILDFRVSGMETFKELNHTVDEYFGYKGDEYKRIAMAVNIRCNGTFVKGWDHSMADADTQKLRGKILEMTKMLIEMGRLVNITDIVDFISNFKR